MGAAEIEQAVVIARGIADEHILQHRFGSARRAAVTDEVGAVLAVTGPAEGHVVPQNLDLFPVFRDRRQSVVRGSWLD